MYLTPRISIPVAGFSEQPNISYLSPSATSPFLAPQSPISTSPSSFSSLSTSPSPSSCASSYLSSSDLEEFVFSMDHLQNVKRLLMMFPPPMGAEEFIAKNPFIAQDGHVKRPSNNFILFRKIAHDQKNLVPELSNYNERQWSQIIGRIWKSLSVEEKKAYKNLGKEVAEKHQEMFPEYKYQPKRDKAAWKHFNPNEENSRKSKNKRKNNRIKQQEQQETTPEISVQNISQQQFVPTNTLDYSCTIPSTIPSASVHTEFLYGPDVFSNFPFNEELYGIEL